LEPSDYLEEGLQEADIRDISKFKYLNKFWGSRSIHIFQTTNYMQKRGFKRKNKKLIDEKIQKKKLKIFLGHQSKIMIIGMCTHDQKKGRRQKKNHESKKGSPVKNHNYWHVYT
jgi:hypothetical protein